jgi:DNA-binding SARP family transcriptional activator
MPVITARLLGPPQLAVDGGAPPPELLWRKPIALCIALWFAPERRRSRDHLVGLLWGESTERAARHSLNEALRIIRRAAGDDAIDTSGDSVRWSGSLDLDTDRFAAVERDDPDTAAELVTGPFCDGFAVPGASEFDAWLYAERTHWQARSIDVLTRAARAVEERGDVGRARTLAERATAVNGHSDLAAQALIRAHWLAGDRAAAMATGETYRRRVETELGRPIDDFTASLIRRVTRERHPTRPPNAAHQERRSPLVDREATLGNLLASTRGNAPSGRARLLVITGAAGSGRSRLLEELVTRATIAGATVAAMRAVDADQRDPDAAALALANAGLGTAAGIAAAPAAAIAAFVQRDPVWAERFPGIAGDAAVPVDDALLQIIRATAEERPLWLAIDDANRLHPDTLRWFAAMMRAVADRPVTLLLTAISGSGDAAMDELIQSAGRSVPGTAERLEPLSSEGIARLVEWAVPGALPESRERLARRVWAESAGLPAIAVDVLHAVRRGLAIDGAAPWPPADRTLDATLPAPLPEPLVAAVRLAYRQLGDDARALLTIAAMLDEPFSADRVGRIAEFAETARRDAALDALEWDGWIVADARGYSFPARTKRRLIHEEMITPGQRRRLATQIAAIP